MHLEGIQSVRVRLEKKNKENVLRKENKVE